MEPKKMKSEYASDLTSDLREGLERYLANNIGALNAVACAAVPLALGVRLLAGEAHAAYDTLVISYNPDQHLLNIIGLEWGNKTLDLDLIPSNTSLTMVSHLQPPGDDVFASIYGNGTTNTSVIAGISKANQSTIVSLPQ